MCENCSLFWSSMFKKEEFKQEYVHRGEGEVEASFYKDRLQQLLYLVQVESRRFDKK